ncbi:major facilitator family transmembrane transporter Mug111 [Schizosaccharomyces osmophilus]|uniref:Major facilitator family transmembrane transporter Mug111 n=1 Tax=Schizosaccharomyces osmophilus TaxID=2545709 RepID=A0AAE9WFL8_9SCHI|nr:major facilitator family transmembrane transporter Mug111 [Schizosaccharomyces osmophilus]WBW75521.1 major facilitator family transmembrane transporter Mug111 [Schizosaccharomyces osmophilus]
MLYTKPASKAVYLWYIFDVTSLSMVNVACLQLIQMLLASHYHVPTEEVREKLVVVTTFASVLQYLAATFVVPVYSLVIKRFSPWFTVLFTWLGEEYMLISSILALLYFKNASQIVHIIVYSISLMQGLSGAGPSIRASWKAIAHASYIDEPFVLFVTSIPMFSFFLGPFFASFLLSHISLFQLYILAWLLHFVSGVTFSLAFYHSPSFPSLSLETQPLFATFEALEEVNCPGSFPSDDENQRHNFNLHLISNVYKNYTKNIKNVLFNSYFFQLTLTCRLLLLSFVFYMPSAVFFDYYVQYLLNVIKFSLEKVTFISSIQTFGTLLTCSVLTYLSAFDDLTTKDFHYILFGGTLILSALTMAYYWALEPFIPFLAFLHGMSRSMEPVFHSLLTIYAPLESLHDYWRLSAILEAFSTCFSYICLAYCYLQGTEKKHFLFFLGPAFLALISCFSSLLFHKYSS